MIAVLLILAAALSAGLLGRAAAQRGWRLHAGTAWACAAILAAAAYVIAFGGPVALPGWLIAAGLAADVLFVAVIVDMHRVKHPEGAR